jgi:micrococcal nuclease
MKRFLVTLVVSAIQTSVAIAQENGPTDPGYLYRAEVTRIVDGDTVDMTIDLGFYIDLREQRVRLLGIEAPEPETTTKAAGDASTQFLKGLIEGKTVIVRTVRGKDEADRQDSFGRWLGTIYLDGKDINQAMIDAGHALPYEGR